MRLLWKLFFKNKNIIVSSGNTIANEEEFKDRVIYLLYNMSKKTLLMKWMSYLYYTEKGEK